MHNYLVVDIESSSITKSDTKNLGIIINDLVFNFLDNNGMDFDDFEVNEYMERNVRTLEKVFGR